MPATRAREVGWLSSFPSGVASWACVGGGGGVANACSLEIYRKINTLGVLLLCRVFINFGWVSDTVGGIFLFLRRNRSQCDWV